MIIIKVKYMEKKIKFSVIKVKKKISQNSKK